MATSLDGKTHVREGVSRTVEVTDLPRDLTGETVHVYLIGDGKNSVGSAAGAGEGDTINIDVTFDLAPGYYEVEIGVDGGPVVWPQDERTPNIVVHDTRYDN